MRGSDERGRVHCRSIDLIAAGYAWPKAAGGAAVPDMMDRSSSCGPFSLTGEVRCKADVTWHVVPQNGEFNQREHWLPHTSF